MTRVIVYSSALVAFVAATAMTFAAITLPTWISYSATPALISNYGLHRLCQAIDLSSTSPNPSSFSSLAHSQQPHCRSFPVRNDCTGSEGHFCILWRTTGFLLSFTAVLQLVVILTFIVVLAGGKQKRETGWRLVAALLLIVGISQAAGSSIVAYLFDHDEKFNVPGFRLGEAWILSTVSYGISFLTAGWLALSALLLRREDGYDLIPSERQLDQ